jgi:hypothetical protein
MLLKIFNLLIFIIQHIKTPVAYAQFSFLILFQSFANAYKGNEKFFGFAINCQVHISPLPFT